MNRRIASKRFLFSVISFLLFLSVAFLPRSGYAEGKHNEYLETQDDCDICHSMSAPDVEDNTASIRKNIRTAWNIKQVNGGKFDNVMGCTFCHYNTGSMVRMKDVLDQF